MKRTQIYLTEEQERLLAARSQDLGVSKAEVIRRLLDERLGLDGGRERHEAISQTAGLLSDYPDWPTWLSAVRGAPADERLRRLGL
ncbi:MAG: hypothetical protein NVSMB32_00470 [Actinomycetota bacterium]